MKSIRRFQIVVLVTGMIVLVAAAEVYRYVSVRESLYAQLDLSLQAKAGAFAALMDYDPPYVELDFTDQDMPEFARADDPEYFQIWVNGQAFDKALALGEADLPFEYGPVDTPLHWNMQLQDGRDGRAIGIALPVALSDDVEEAVDVRPTAVIVVARERESVDAALTQILTGFTVSAVILAAMLAGLVWWTIGRAMRPVRVLSRETGEIDESTLNHRVGTERLPAELEPIALALNRLLERLERAFDREKRTTASIAHELRTPISELRTAADVALRWPDDNALTRRAVQTAQDVSVQMEHTVSLLLTVARLDCGQAELHPEPVDLQPLVDSCYEHFRGPAGEKNIDLRSEISDPINVLVDKSALELLLANIVSNAIEHAPRAGTVRCLVAPNGASLRLTIANSNNGLKEEDLERLTEPFWTKDDSRSKREHCGLGLTLVRSVADAADVDLSFDLVDGEFRVTMAFATPT